MYVSGPSVQMKDTVHVVRAVVVYGVGDYSTSVVYDGTPGELIAEVNDLFKQGRAALLDVTEYDEVGLSKQVIGVWFKEATPYADPPTKFIITVKDPDYVEPELKPDDIPTKEERLLAVLRDGKWHSARELSTVIGHRFGAAIFNVRKHGYIIDKRYTGMTEMRAKCYEYRLTFPF